MLSQDRLLALIGGIYDAAADESLWPQFLKSLGNALNGASIGLIYHDMRALRANLMMSAHIDPECERQYIEHFSAIDPFRAAWLHRFQHPAPEAVQTGEQLIEPREFTRSAYYNDFAAVHDVVHHLTAPIAVHADWAANLSCNRGVSKGPFDPEDVNLLRILFPHLQRAIHFHRRFAELAGQQRASLDALDQLSVGVILLDCGSKISALNREAERIFGKHDGLSATKHGITATRSIENCEIKRLVAGATETAQKRGTGSGGFIAVSRPSGKRPFALSVVPLATHAFCLGISAPAVIVFVTDPERKAEDTSLVLSRLYGLTAAESRLAELLLQGETVVRAAGRLNISHNTARTHLQRIFQKTDTSHQGDLVRLLLTALPGVFAASEQDAETRQEKNGRL